MIKVYVVGGYYNYTNWIENHTIVKKLEDADLILFAGGEDVHPSLYKEPTGQFTSANIRRDLEEKKYYKEAKHLKKPVISICRGSQFICVMNGGKLVQHQENPSFLHNIQTYDGRTLEVTSTHHQAAFPYNLPKENYELIGWSENLSRFHVDGNNEEMSPPYEAEVVYYPKSNDLGIQSHPEMYNNKEVHVYFNNLIKEKLLCKKQSR